MSVVSWITSTELRFSVTMSEHLRKWNWAIIAYLQMISIFKCTEHGHSLCSLCLSSLLTSNLFRPFLTWQAQLPYIDEKLLQVMVFTCLTSNLFFDWRFHINEFICTEIFYQISMHNFCCHITILSSTYPCRVFTYYIWDLVNQWVLT